MPNPVGRPSKYDPAYCERVIELGAEGRSEVQISAMIDVPRTTMRSWADKHDDFSSALTRAIELSQAWWETQAQENLSNREFNAALWAKNVASRFRADYGDRVVQEHVGKNDGPIQHTEVSALDVIEGRIAGIASRTGTANGASKPH